MPHCLEIRHVLWHVMMNLSSFLRVCCRLSFSGADLGHPCFASRPLMSHDAQVRQSRSLLHTPPSRRDMRSTHACNMMVSTISWVAAQPAPLPTGSWLFQARPQSRHLHRARAGSLASCKCALPRTPDHCQSTRCCQCMGGWLGCTCSI